MLALGVSLGWDVIVFEGIMATGVSCNSSVFSTIRLQELQNWMKELPCHGIEQTPCGTERLDEGIVRAIEEQVDVPDGEEGLATKTVTMRVRPHLLYRPLGALGITQIPDPTASYDIFDRVVNVRDGE